MFTVMVFDMARTGEPDGERLVAGFATLEAATAYAIARVRASVEELRGANTAPAKLKSLWHMFGEDCSVLGNSVRGSDLLDDFIANPASPAECDWVSLKPRLRRFRATLLISNENGESVWCGGFFHAWSRLSAQDLLDRFREDAAAVFAAKGITPGVPVNIHVANHFELLEPPRPAAGDQRPLKSWKVEVDFVCHDVKFGGSNDGVFAWPEKPAGEALAAMTSLLIGDSLAIRGNGPDYVAYTDVLAVRIAETDTAADFPLD